MVGGAVASLVERRTGFVHARRCARSSAQHSRERRQPAVGDGDADRVRRWIRTNGMPAAEVARAYVESYRRKANRRGDLARREEIGPAFVTRLRWFDQDGSISPFPWSSIPETHRASAGRAVAPGGAHGRALRRDRRTRTRPAAWMVGAGARRAIRRISTAESSFRGSRVLIVRARRINSAGGGPDECRQRMRPTTTTRSDR